jgi:hypothetical protein
LVARPQGAFQRPLHQIIGIRGISRERPRKPAQPREQWEQLALESLQQASPIMEETGVAARFIHMLSKICQDVARCTI